MNYCFIFIATLENMRSSLISKKKSWTWIDRLPMTSF